DSRGTVSHLRRTDPLGRVALRRSRRDLRPGVEGSPRRRARRETAAATIPCVTLESIWSAVYGPWPPPPPRQGVSRIKRPMLRLAAGWSPPSDPVDGGAIAPYH